MSIGSRDSRPSLGDFSLPGGNIRRRKKRPRNASIEVHLASVNGP